MNSLREEGVIVKKIIAAGKIRRYFSLLYIWELIKLPLAALESFVKVLLINPDVVLGKGSYGSVLPVLAARILGKKIILHESDVIPGLANRFLAKFAYRIAVSFKETAQYFPNKNIIITGNPVRLKYLALTRFEAATILNFSANRKTIFISGGSQGARKINQIVLDSLKELLKTYAVIWSIGANNSSIMVPDMMPEDLVGKLKLTLFFSEKELMAAYTLCDAVVGRAGSGTIFEAAAFGKPAILIPIESAGNHQLYNAQAYAGSGAAKILRESELSSITLLKTLNDLMTNDQLLLQMSQNAQKFAKIESADNLAKILLDL